MQTATDHPRDDLPVLEGARIRLRGFREADIDPRNAGSCRLGERMGIVREGLLRDRWQVGGEISDSAMYGLLATDWRTKEPVGAT